MRIILLGAPGAGKGTQCKHIVKRYGLVHLSSGDILRQERAAGTELGQKAQQYMDSGALVPDDLIVKMMAEAIKKALKAGFVLDGFPRTVNQAIALDASLKCCGEKIDAVVNLRVSEEVLIQRITGRRICPKCGAVYHLKNLRPKVDGICDRDGAELVQRPDDTVKVVKERLRNYHRQTRPVVDYYKSRSSVQDVDANDDADRVSELIFESLDTLVGVRKVNRSTTMQS
jgi:adenylate kinase